MSSIAVQHAAVVPAAAGDRSRVVAALVAAFVEDPLIRWMFPDSEQYLASFPQVLRFFGGGAFDLGTAHRSADFAGAALWLPPGVAPDEEALGGVMEEECAPELLGEVFGLLEQVGTSRPDVQHWYLPAIGVDPVRQGLGYGSALLAHALAEVDGQQVAAYLESSNPRNIPLYEAFGFEVVAEIQSGTSPTIYPMLRAARGSG